MAARASLKVSWGLRYQGSLSRGNAILSECLAGPQRDKREQPEQGRGCAADRPIRPLPLGLDAEMSAHLGKGHLDGPAPNEPADNVEWIGLEIGTEKALRLELAIAITH